MSKKRIIAIIASLLIVLGISYGAYASVNKNQSSAANSTSQVSKKKSSSKDAQPQEVGLKGKAKAKKSAKTTKATKKAEAAKTESEKKVAASQASSSQKVVAQKAAQESSSQQATQQQAAASTSQAAVASKQAAASQATQHQAANTNQQAQTTTTAAQPATKKVTVSIYGPISEGNKLLINHDSVAMNDGDKVIDVLKRDTAGHGMALSYKGAASTVYVQGINGLFEFDRGQQSGWLYRVNGVFPNYSCGSYTVKSGDVIEWMYTEDLGHDRNAPQG